MPHREGFLCAGPWVMEQLKVVEHYPNEGGHALITHEQQRPGGNAFEMISELRRLDAGLSLYALGLLGEDQDGHAILSACHKLEVDTFQLQVTDVAPTAHTIVIEDEARHSQTRLYFPGANQLLGEEHFDFRRCLASWFHLSDHHLLERLSRKEEGGAAANKTLLMARAAGLQTSLVATTCDHPADLLSMLTALDCLVINDRVWEALAGRALRSAHSFLEQARSLAASLFQGGIQDSFAVLFPEGAFAILSSGESAWLPMPQTSNAKPLTNAAFSAVFLYGRYSGWTLERCLAETLALR